MQNFSIYRLCRNSQTCEKLKTDSEKYGFQKSNFYFNVPYFKIIEDVLEKCEDDVALICHGDTILPLDISFRINSAIENAVNKVGENWGMIGNFGIEFLSYRKIKFIRDFNSKMIPAGSEYSKPVVYIDDNLLVLNVKVLRERKLKVFELEVNSKIFSNILLAECYLKDLICFVDSNLFVFHKNLESNFKFNNTNEKNIFCEYWQSRFINNAYLIPNKVISLKNFLRYLDRDSGDGRVDFYKKIEENILRNINKKIELNIIIRTQLKRLNYIYRSLDLIVASNTYNKDLALNVILVVNNTLSSNLEEDINKIKDKYNDIINITFIFSEKSGLYPRVQSIKDGVIAIKNEASFVWIVDDDDFIFPNTLKYFTSLLNHNQIFIGDSVVFNEKWNTHSFPEYSRKDRLMNGREYCKVLSGDNHIPVCSVIYPINVLKTIFNENNLNGDYAEDYTILLLALNKYSSVYYPLSVAGISVHGGNTVTEKDRTHWDYSYVTFMSEIVNSGFVKEWMFDFMESEKKEKKCFFSISQSIFSMDKLRLPIKAIRVLKKRGVKKSLFFLHMYFKYGRKYFQDGIENL